MPFALLVIGVVLIVSAINGTQSQLVLMLRRDFTGTGNFVYWLAALLAIGAIGYIEKLKPVSDGFLVLVILVLLLSRGNPKFNSAGGFFKQLTTALGATGSAPAVSVGVGPGGVSVGVGGPTVTGSVPCPSNAICDTQGRVIGSVPPGGAPVPFPIPTGPF
jgi:hypothetical protein